MCVFNCPVGLLGILRRSPTENRKKYATLGVYMYIWYIHFFVYIIYTKKCIYKILYIHLYILYIYTVYEIWKMCVYMYIYSVYEIFEILYIYMYISYIQLFNFVGILFVKISLLLEICSLSVYMIYTLFVYILYIYTCIWNLNLVYMKCIYTCYIYTFCLYYIYI